MDNIIKIKKTSTAGLARGRYTASTCALVRKAIANAGIEVSRIVLRIQNCGPRQMFDFKARPTLRSIHNS